jgi:predicted glycoside hydrolase/deacetylase ChbG (UPF0249 family)
MLDIPHSRELKASEITMDAIDGLPTKHYRRSTSMQFGMRTVRSMLAALAFVVIPVLALAEEKLTATTPRKQPPRLIVRGDDMGFSHSGNEALIRCFQEGIETSIEVLVPSPWFPEAGRLLAQNPKVDVGVHLALTSEWDNIKWRPLTDAASLKDSDGYFFPMIHRNQNYPKRALMEHEWRIDDIEKEFRAQIEMARKYIPRVSHLSGHMGCDHLNDDVKKLTRKLAKEYGLDINPADFGVKSVGLKGLRGTSEEKIASFIKLLESLEDETTSLFVEHPGLDSPELRAISHIGYENVAADRQGVTDMWTDERVRKLIEARGIQLIGYRDLKKNPDAK